MKKMIEEKRIEIQNYNTLAQKAEKELRQLKLKYVKETFGVEEKMFFTEDKTMYAIEFINVYMDLDKENIFLSCSKLLKSGRWSVRTKLFTLADYLELKND